MLIKAATILSRICVVILGLVTKRHMKSKHNIHRNENISGWDISPLVILLALQLRRYFCDFFFEKLVAVS